LNKRNALYAEMKKRKLFPSNDDISELMDAGTLYPDVEDPNFVSRLLKKSEFADTMSHPLVSDENPCESGPDFEATPVQRFVANFLHPRTPYMSALLYHGVGVGKTCAAIQTAEAYLDVYPRSKVMIVAPPTIQAGFYRTIFDIEKLVIRSGDQPNQIQGCTGTTYLRIIGGEFERNKEVIERRVKSAIRKRYEFFGYLQFRNHIRSVINKTPVTNNEEINRLRRIEAIRREFNFRLLIIDEAHNLRDTGSTGPVSPSVLDDPEDIDTAGTEDEKEQEKAGKLLTPFLNELINSNEGMKLLLMTATPMFNNVKEIVLLLSLLLRNDKKADITQSQIMDDSGNLIEGADLVLRPIANAYISFMRGENPNSFPIRLYPKGDAIQRITSEIYPRLQFAKTEKEISEDERKSMSNLPLVASMCPEDSFSEIILSDLTNKRSKEGAGYTIIDNLLQAGNCVFPSGDDLAVEEYIGLKGFQHVFTRQKGGTFSTGDRTWLFEDEFSNYSPKCATILRSIKHANGICFVYSRFVTTGALLLALAMEVNGFTRYGGKNLLTNAKMSPGLRQCALCSSREVQHTNKNHPFTPAQYILLTGDKELSPNNPLMINIARSAKNVDGGIVKAILGSQIAGEGLDLRFVREVHILDAWFHLNKTEQIIGRGIRYCSHSLITKKEERNTTVFLHVVTLPNFEMETADLFCYRNALKKAILVGKVSRKLKEFAIDCNLRKNVTVLTGLGRRIQIDSQGLPRKREDDDPLEFKKGIKIDDMPYTAICDWMECAYDCTPTVNINLETSDDSTYTGFSVRYRETRLQKVIQTLFARQHVYSGTELLSILQLTGAPRIAIDMTLQGIINNRLFRVKSGAREGYITYKNRYFIFQPDKYKDTTIPISLRSLDFPIKRDEFTPSTKEFQKTVNEEMNPSLWPELVNWVKKVVSGQQTTIGVEIERQIETYTPDFKQKQITYKEKLAMIVLFAKKIQNKEVLEQVVLEYLWDEWLSNTIQFQHKNEYISVAREINLISGTTKANRFIDPNTNELYFICEDGQKCSSGIVQAFSKIIDPVKERKATKKLTGSLYGYVVPKRGVMVFKTNEPHDDDKKPGRGQECGIITAREQHVKNLVRLGSELEKVGAKKIEFAPEEISNANRGCTILDLLLRYMDIVEIGKKRWFFRPLAAYYSGHRGLVSSSVIVKPKKEKTTKTVKTVTGEKEKKA